MASQSPVRAGHHPPPAALDGPDKVAALLLAMGRPIAGKLLVHFAPNELKAVTRAAADLPAISPADLERIIEEFAQHFSEGASVQGTAAELEKLLSGVMSPEQVSDIMSDVLGSTNRSIWERMSSVSENVLAPYLLKEHSQIAALILSKVRPACAAKVMEQLPPNFRDDLMRRMLSLKPIVEEAMRIVEHTLHEDFMMNFARKMGADAYARMADIINKMERGHMEDALQSLTAARPKAAEVLKGLLFTFDDVVNLTPRARQAIFDQIPVDRVVTALKGTDQAFRELVLSSLALRTRRMVEHELGAGEPSPQREVLEARRAITDLALEMAGRGEIELTPENFDEPVVR
jgi:flagellar motor switch protein FliG